MPKEHAYYLMYKGEELLGMGTTRELAEQFNVKRETIWGWQKPSYLEKAEKWKGKRNYRVVVRVE